MYASVGLPLLSALFAAWSANSLPGIPMWPGVQHMEISFPRWMMSWIMFLQFLIMLQLWFLVCNAKIAALLSVKIVVSLKLLSWIYCSALAIPTDSAKKLDLIPCILKPFHNISSDL